MESFFYAVMIFTVNDIVLSAGVISFISVVTTGADNLLCQADRSCYSPSSQLQFQDDLTTM